MHHVNPSWNIIILLVCAQRRIFWMLQAQWYLAKLRSDMPPYSWGVVAQFFWSLQACCPRGKRRWGCRDQRNLFSYEGWGCAEFEMYRSKSSADNEHLWVTPNCEMPSNTSSQSHMAKGSIIIVNGRQGATLYGATGKWKCRWMYVICLHRGHWPSI